MPIRKVTAKLTNIDFDSFGDPAVGELGDPTVDISRLSPAAKENISSFAKHVKEEYEASLNRNNKLVDVRCIHVDTDASKNDLLSLSTIATMCGARRLGASSSSDDFVKSFIRLPTARRLAESPSLVVLAEQKIDASGGLAVTPSDTPQVSITHNGIVAFADTAIPSISEPENPVSVAPPTVNRLVSMSSAYVVLCIIFFGNSRILI